MNKKIHLINYGFGNPASVKNALEFLNYNCKVVDHNTNLSDITHLILPGVGSFDHVIKSFNNSGLRDKVEKKVLELEKSGVIKTSASIFAKPS